MANVLLEVGLPEWQVWVTYSRPGIRDCTICVGFDARLVQLATTFMEFTNEGSPTHAAFTQRVLLLHVHKLMLGYQNKYVRVPLTEDEVYLANLAIRFRQMLPGRGDMHERL